MTRKIRIGERRRTMLRERDCPESSTCDEDSAIIRLTSTESTEHRVQGRRAFFNLPQRRAWTSRRNWNGSAIRTETTTWSSLTSSQLSVETPACLRWRHLCYCDSAILAHNGPRTSLGVCSEQNSQLVLNRTSAKSATWYGTSSDSHTNSRD